MHAWLLTAYTRVLWSPLTLRALTLAPLLVPGVLTAQTQADGDTFGGSGKNDPWRGIFAGSLKDVSCQALEGAATIGAVVCMVFVIWNIFRATTQGNPQGWRNALWFFIGACFLFYPIGIYEAIFGAGWSPIKVWNICSVTTRRS